MSEPEFHALQTEAEIAAFCDIIRAEGCTRYLEIGSKMGGSLWRVANAMPKGSRLVAVDMTAHPKLLQCVATLKSRWFDAHLILGNSRDAAIVEAVNAFGPFDAVFIDGDHLLEGVTADWENYGPLGRIVAFHDIAWKRPPDWPSSKRIDVAQLWGRIKTGYRHEEIKFCPTGRNNGIGVLWRS